MMLVLCHGQPPRNGRESCHSQREEHYLVLVSMCFLCALCSWKIFNPPADSVFPSPRQCEVVVNYSKLFGSACPKSKALQSVTSTRHGLAVIVVVPPRPRGGCVQVQGIRLACFLCVFRCVLIWRMAKNSLAPLPPRC